MNIQWTSGYRLKKPLVIYDQSAMSSETLGKQIGYLLSIHKYNFLISEKWLKSFYFSYKRFL